jgi:spermidine dehydrogenase
MPDEIDSGSNDGITRRDFLDGVAIGAAGLAIAAAAPHLTGAEAAELARGGRRSLPPGHYPPTDTGLIGHTDPVVRATMKIDGRPNPDDVHSTRGGPGIKRPVRDTGEVYDCVIVGAGASGLAAAKFYRDRFGPDSKILVLDPLEDFGGHSHRNEFHIPDASAGNADVLILRNGGVFNLDSVGSWDEPSGAFLDVPPNQPALDLLDFCGVDPNNFPSTTGPGVPSSFGLRSMVLFPAADWGSDTLAQNKLSSESWETFLARTPYSQEARDAILRIQTDTTTDWIEQRDGPMSPEQKLDLLTRISQKQYLMRYVGAPEEAIVQYQRNGHSLLGAGAQAISAADAWMLGQAGFDGVALPDPTEVADNGFPGIGRTPQMGNQTGAEPSPLWPDGNASLLRLLVSKLIPGSFADVNGAPPNQENIVVANVDYSRLDRRSNDVRIRLRSFVFNVKPGKHGRDLAEVDYVEIGTDKGRRVRGRHVIMACWNRVTAHIVDGLSKRQVENLCYARKVPLIYGRAGLRNWKAFADAKISSVSPRGNSLFWDSTSLQMGARFGSVYGPTPNQPDQPATLSFQVVPTGHDRTPQLAAYEEGRRKLLEMSFRDLERALIDVLDRSVNVSGGDFDPERDIQSLMVNRWNYGYAHELTSVWDPSLYGAYEDQPQVKGRAPFRNVSIANSDSQAFAYTHSAITEGKRAVDDLPFGKSRRRRARERERVGSAA